MASENINWHRLFGLILTDFFTDSPFVVELEKDLSIKKQLLDVVIIRKGEGVLKEPLPDGLENLADHNLITFKSYQETLDDWALKELTGHYVNYRKQISPTMQDLLPEVHFRLYAICARFPQNLAQQTVWTAVGPGVYECRRGTDVIRILVAGQLPQSENNALLHLFAASADQVRYGAGHYHRHSGSTSSLLDNLFKQYRKEGVNMAYTMEDFMRDYTEDFLERLTPEKRLKGLTPEELLKALPAEERLKGLPAEERLKGLTLDERLKGLTQSERDELLKKLLKKSDEK